MWQGSYTSGWSDGVKVSCILRHRGVQLILAYIWSRPAILVAGKGRGECFYFFCFFTFIPVPLSSLFLSFISTISSISFLPSFGRWHKMTHKGWRVVKPQHNQSYTSGNFFFFFFQGQEILCCVGEKWKFAKMSGNVTFQPNEAKMFGLDVLFLLNS